MHLSLTSVEIQMAIYEGIWLGLILLVQKIVRSRSPEASTNFLDKGPWWSILVHRVWIAGHIPALIFELVVTRTEKAIFGKNRLAFNLPSFHLTNYTIMTFSLGSSLLT